MPASDSRPTFPRGMAALVRALLLGIALALALLTAAVWHFAPTWLPGMLAPWLLFALVAAWFSG